MHPLALLPAPFFPDAAHELGVAWQGGITLWCEGMEAQAGDAFGLTGTGGSAVVALSPAAAARGLPEPWRSEAGELLSRGAPAAWQLRSRSLELGRRTLIMGILNVTPDSFSDGGQHLDLGAAIRHARLLAEEGADILDIGGESTRPGSAAVPLEEERSRVMPVLEALQKENYRLPISVDTQKWAVAREALLLGAEIVNDVSAGLADAQMLRGVAQSGAGLVLMHGHVQESRHRGGLELLRFLRERARAAEAAGVQAARIALDPGIGFGKHPDESYAALRRIGELRRLGYPVLLGPSRKRFLAAATNQPVERRDYATAAAVAIGIALGADIVRVHAVREMRDAVLVADRAVRG